MMTTKQGGTRGKEPSGKPFFKDGDNSVIGRIWMEMSMPRSRDQP